MFGNVTPTPFDLNFSLFGIPVRIHPFFWLVAILTGWNPYLPKLIVIWVACFFVSILVHEMGHALTAKYYGWGPHVVLYSFGGYAAFTPTWGYSTGRSIFVTFAGPGAGFILYAVVRAIEFALVHQRVELSPYAEVALTNLKNINLWWGLVNLLPVFPLDGGQICRTALMHWRPSDGFEIALKLSLVTACAMALFCYQYGRTHENFPFDPLFTALLFGALAFENLQMLQRPRSPW
jgi:Zn-dependent protease